MYKLLIGITIISFFIGCSSKIENKFIQTYKKNNAYHLQLQKTEKLKLSDENSTKVLLTASYLFKPISDMNDTRDEKFIVGIYIDDEDLSFEGEEYSLTLNGNVPKSIKSLENSNDILKNISFNSEWTSFYLFTFPHLKSKKLKLIFKSNSFKDGELHFAKVAKYTFNKEIF